ncbi:hypothetical protein EHI8A_055180 [Entamoeba histolytica HM-1:IMSS-B]|uniref:RIC1 C-terminal alpha solenoid region domain-containing protein n=2 Tax=Entamoeba histolytica TaxID=5759 RepID=A0A175JI08_ENTHI|nr:hypothetical protein EHI8A_055180 [Entamoeba histolytica HM-1:IMSS-B]GAT93330.1 hypothetical protein CL6EHI_012940 [Entamoeba histolytica]
MQPTLFKPVYIPYHTQFKLIEQSHSNCIYQSICTSDSIHSPKIPCIERKQSSITSEDHCLTRLTPRNLRLANLIEIDNTQRNKRFLSNNEEHDISKLRGEKFNILQGLFIQPFLHYTEVLVIVTDINISVVDISGNDFIIFPPFIHQIDNIQVTKGCFIKDTNCFYLISTQTLYCFEVVKRDPSSLPLSVYRPSTTFYLYPKLINKIEFAKEIIGIFPFDQSVLISFIDNTFTSSTQPNSGFKIQNGQMDMTVEDIDVTSLIISSECTSMIYRRNDMTIVFAGLVEGSCLPIIKSTFILPTNIKSYIISETYYFALIDEDNKILIYQYSPLNFTCHKVKIIQKSIYCNIDTNTFTPKIQFLPNNNLIIQCNGLSTIITPNGIVINSIEEEGNYLIDSNCCRLFKIPLFHSQLIVNETKLMNTIEMNDLAIQYTSTTINIITNTIHSTKKVYSFIIPQELLCKYFYSIQSISVYPINDTYLFILKQPQSLVLFDSISSIQAVIPIDLCILNNTISWEFDKGTLILFQLSSSLLHILAYKYPNFTLPIYDSIEIIPPLENIQITKKHIKSSSTQNLKSNQFIDLSNSINSFGILLTNIKESFVYTLIGFPNQIGLLTWKIGYKNNLFTFQLIKSSSLIRNDSIDLHSSIPIQFTSSFSSSDYSSPKTTIILWSNFVVTLTKSDSKNPCEIINDSVHSISIPFKNILLVQQTGNVVIRHLDSLFYTFTIPVKLSLLITSPPYLTVLSPDFPSLQSQIQFSRPFSLKRGLSILSDSTEFSNSTSLISPSLPSPSSLSSSITPSISQGLINENEIIQPYNNSPGLIPLTTKDITMPLCEGLKEYNYLGEIMLVELTNGKGIKEIEEEFGNDTQIWENELAKCMCKVTEGYHDKKIGYTTYETVVNYISRNENSRKIILNASTLIKNEYWNELFEIVDSPIVIFIDCLEKEEYEDAIKCLLIIIECYNKPVALQYSIELIQTLFEKNTQLQLIPEIVSIFFKDINIIVSTEESAISNYLFELIKRCIYQLLERNSFEILYKFCEKDNPFLIKCFDVDSPPEIDILDGLKKAQYFVKLHSPQRVLSFGKILLENKHYTQTLLFGISSKLKALLIFDQSYYYLELLSNEFQYTNLELAELLKKYRDLSQNIQPSLLSL